MHIHCFVIVPAPIITILPSNYTSGAVVGSELNIQCIVSTVSGVELSSVMISWMGPGGESITNDSRVTISPTTSSGNNYTSNLQFTYLIREDEGLYMCKTEILATKKSTAFEIDNIIGKFIMIFVMYVRTCIFTIIMVITTAGIKIECKTSNSNNYYVLILMVIIKYYIRMYVRTY